MDFGEASQNRSTWLSRYLHWCNISSDRIALADPKKVAALHDTLLKQQKKLHILVKKVLHAIKCMECCISIKGFILPLDEIRDLLSSYSNNIQNIRCYEAGVQRRKALATKLFNWSFIVFIIASAIHAIVGGAFIILYGNPPFIYDIAFRNICQIVTTEYYTVPENIYEHFVKRRIVEERTAFLRADPSILPSKLRLKYAPLYMTNSTVMALFCAIFIIILIVIPLVKGISVAINRTATKMDNLCAMEEGAILSKKFFDMLYEKKDVSQNALTIEKNSDSAPNQESRRLLTAQFTAKHAIYGRDLFRYDEQMACLVMRLKEWIKAT